MQDRIKTTQELDAQWVRRGKKYKAKYFGALKELFMEVDKEVTNDKDCQIQSTKQGRNDNWEENTCPNRRSRPNKVDSLD